MKSRRGAMFISSLVLASMVLMLIGSAYQLLGTRIHQADNLEDSDGARLAAEAGTRYAHAQLQKDPGWRGGDSTTTVVNQPGTIVVEDHGNVLGILTDLDGNVRQFRIRFNFHNGTSTAPDEGLDDPATYWFDSPYVSVNNLSNSGPAPMYRAEPSSGQMRVLSSSPQPYQVARFSGTVIVEGLAGDALRSTTPAQWDPPANMRRTLSRVALETTLARADLVLIDSALYSAGETAVQLDPTNGVMNVTSQDGSPPKIRSLSSIEVYGQDNSVYRTAADGKVHIGDSGGAQFRVAGGVSSSAAGAGSPQSANKQVKTWPRLKWSEVRRAPTSGNRLPAGIYVWRDSPTRQLEYYNEEYAGGPPVGPVTQVNPPMPSSITVNNTGLRMRITDSTYIEPTGAATGFTVLADPALTALGKRPQTIFSPPAGSTEAPVLSTDGGVYLESSLDGLGSITAEQSITFQGTSAFQTNPGQSVALYAKQDIEVLPVPPTVATHINSSVSMGGSDGDDDGGDNDDDGDDSGGSTAPATTLGHFMGTSLPFTPSAQDIAFGGMLYALGNIKMDLTSSGGQGNLYMRGIMSAYGGDPELNQDPGSDPLTGKVVANITNGMLVYDPAYAAQTGNMSAPSPLVVTFQAQLQR